ncbi:MAG: DUF1330 domain-containing protein, partial [Alphaproteobacteria bacterium]
MSVYVVGRVMVKYPSWIDGYIPAVQAIVESHGGKYLVRSPDMDCPSSKYMGPLSLFHNGGSGSSWIDVKPLGADGSSGG